MVNSKKNPISLFFFWKNSNFTKVKNGLEHVFISDDVKGFYGRIQGSCHFRQ